MSGRDCTTLYETVRVWIQSRSVSCSLLQSRSLGHTCVRLCGVAAPGGSGAHALRHITLCVAMFSNCSFRARASRQARPWPNVGVLTLATASRGCVEPRKPRSARTPIGRFRFAENSI
jgi:hypothetical protein